MAIGGGDKRGQRGEREKEVRSRAKSKETEIGRDAVSVTQEMRESIPPKTFPLLNPIQEAQLLEKPVQE